jgi:hypothetical protein
VPFVGCRRITKDPSTKGTGSGPAVPPFFPIRPRRTRLSERSNGRDPARAHLPAHPGSSALSSIRPLPPVSHQHRLAQAVANLLLRFNACYVGGVYRFDNRGVNWGGTNTLGRP